METNRRTTKAVIYKLQTTLKGTVDLLLLKFLLNDRKRLRSITPSASMTSPGVSQWTVNENSFGTQTTQTDNFWNDCDSFNSSKSYTMGKQL